MMTDIRETLLTEQTVILKSTMEYIKTQDKIIRTLMQSNALIIGRYDAWVEQLKEANMDSPDVSPKNNQNGSE